MARLEELSSLQLNLLNLPVRLHLQLSPRSQHNPRGTRDKYEENCNSRTRNDAAKL